MQVFRILMARLARLIAIMDNTENYIMEIEKTFTEPGFYFQWHFLETCNLRCKHCYQDGYVPQPANLTLVGKTIAQIEKALTIWDIPGRVSITGGEPLLDTRTLFTILDGLTAVERVNHIGILTNGTLLTSPLVTRLGRYVKLKEVQVSLDGASAEVHDATRGVGNFNRAIAGLKLLIQARIPTAIMFTASKINHVDAINVINLAIELGVNAITIERYTPFHGSDDPLALNKSETRRMFEDVLKKKIECHIKGCAIKIRTSRPLWNLLSPTCGGVCPVGYSCLTIMHNGVLYPCRRLPVKLGTVQGDGLFKVWYTSPVLRELRKRDNIEQCSSCEKNHLCGGCRAAAYASTGNYMSPDPLCWKE